MKLSQLLLQLNMKPAGTRDVAGATSSSSMTLQGLSDQEKTEGGQGEETLVRF